MDFRRPTFVRIPSVKDTRRLYRLEERRNEMIKQCATEWIKVVSDQFPHLARLISEATEEDRLFKIALPQQLYEVLDGFDEQAATLAAEFFLKARGYDVKAPPQSCCGEAHHPGHEHVKY